MSLVVIETNAAVVANGRDDTASPQCRYMVMNRLMSVLTNDCIVIDNAGEMLDEYRRYCNPVGQPGLGDRFFRELLMNYSSKIQRITLEKNANGDFKDFPSDPDLASFDRSDRKFAAAARKANAPVLNATDTDWIDHKEALLRNGIAIEFLCGCDPAVWFVDKT